MSMRRPGDYRERLPQGTVLLREGERGSEFFLLEDGLLHVFIKERKVGEISAARGQEFVGEVGAILELPRTATVVAAEECIVLRLPKPLLRALFAASPSLGVRLVRSLCRKLAESAHALAEFQVQNTAVRGTGSVEISLRNYAKGVLALMEEAADDSTGEAAKRLPEWFRESNPWGVRRGERRVPADLLAPETVGEPDERAGAREGAREGGPVAGDEEAANDGETSAAHNRPET